MSSTKNYLDESQEREIKKYNICEGFKAFKYKMNE